MVYSLYPNRRGMLEQLESPPQTQHIFPTSSDLTSEFLTIAPHTKLKITRETSIASIGSCFAREIRKWIIKSDYIYPTRPVPEQVQGLLAMIAFTAPLELDKNLSARLEISLH